ncbi:hypothetical protein TRVA0_030S00694 [Trichomonascus vanleenenianus]|uniref:FG-nucleoporin NUP60 n=1 Tax=Trichomonascus vanleenenianus TaxID=2268995 RepID=UPI003ECA5142
MKTPYERRSNVTPLNRAKKTASTPAIGGLFSRVKSFFTPRLWRSTDETVMEEDSEDETMIASPDHVFNFPPPSVARPNYDRFSELSDQLRSSPGSPMSPNVFHTPQAHSPNERLSEFFRQKGDAPLSEMETEGVLSLIRQAAEQNESLVEIEPSSLTPRRQLRASEPSSVITPMRASMKSTASTPMTQYSPFYTPGSHKADDDEKRESGHHANTSFGSIPTPYRAHNRSLSRRSSYIQSPQPGIEPPSFDFESDAQNEAKEEEAAVEQQPKKSLSQTASALLSLIGEPESAEKGRATGGREEKAKKRSGYNDLPPDMEQAINPYVRRSAKKTKTKSKKSESPVSPTPNGSKAAKDTSRSAPIKDLERTMPADIRSQVQSTPTLAAEKYKPARSSSLRQTVVASPDTTPEKMELPKVSTFTFTSPHATPKKSIESEKTVQPKPHSIYPTIKEVKQQREQKSSPAPALVKELPNTEAVPSPKFTFGKIASDTPEKSSTAVQPAAESNVPPAVSDEPTQKASTLSFEFATPEKVSANITDISALEKYKDMFNF